MSSPRRYVEPPPRVRVLDFAASSEVRGLGASRQLSTPAARRRLAATLKRRPAACTCVHSAKHDLQT